MPEMFDYVIDVHYFSNDIALSTEVLMKFAEDYNAVYLASPIWDIGVLVLESDSVLDLDELKGRLLGGGIEVLLVREDGRYVDLNLED